MTDRRTDTAGLNLQQRVFDALGTASGMLSMGALTAATGLPEIVLTNALQRLRRMKCLRSMCVDGEWRYGLRPGAQRPTDRRGGRTSFRQVAQETSA